MAIRSIFIIAVTGALLAGCGGGESAAASEPVATASAAAAAVLGNTRPIVLGDVADDPAKKIARFTPLADYLGANLGERGIAGAEIKIAPDMETMATWLATGQVDLYFDSLYPAMIVSDRSGAQPILRRWKDGVSEYHTVIFARADSGIESLDDLRDQVIALDEEFSTSGFLLPVAYLAEHGLRATPVEGGVAPTAGDVGYSFSGDDDNTLQWVISGRTVAGAVDDEQYQSIPEEIRAGLVIIAETMSVPRQVVVSRPGLDEALVGAITELFVGLDESPEGEAVLEVFKTTQFDEFPEGPEAAFATLRTLYDLVVAD